LHYYFSMLTLHRQRFPDVPMDGDTIDAAAEMWIGWYRLARKDAAQAAPPFHRLQIRVWGFARTSALALQQLLIRRVQSFRLACSTVERPDPDTLSVTTPWLDFSQTCLPSELSTLFADPAFTGLPMMLRFTVEEHREKPGGEPAASRTLVLCGQWHDGTLIVKAVWPAGNFGTEDRLYELAVWPLETRFLEDLDCYRNTGELQRTWETEFRSQAHDRMENRLLRSVVILPGQPKLRVFLSQVILFLVLLVTGLLLLPLVLLHKALVLPGVALIAVGAWGLFYVTRARIRVIALRHASMQRALKQLHAKPLKFMPVNMADWGLQDDPSTRKFSTELEALGCQHCADLCTEFRQEGISVFRHYALPAERTFITLALRISTRTNKLFPAGALLVASTYFAGGHRLVCSSTDLVSRKNPIPNVTACRWRDTHDPESFLNRLRAKVRQMLAEGQQLAEPMALDDHLTRLKDDFAHLSAYRRKTGYFSWLDAVRQEFRKRDQQA
jgi:hypothetical protein